MSERISPKDKNGVEKFWNSAGRSSFTCPDTAFFRFVAHLDVQWEGGSVLDLGFGQGHDLFEVCRRGANGYGIDIDRRVVDEINNIDSEYPKAIVGSIQDVSSLLKADFDLVYCLNAMYYLSEAELNSALKSISSVLKPGGLFVFQALTGDFRNEAGSSVLDNSSIMKDESNPILFRGRDFYTDLVDRSTLEICGIKSMKETFKINEEATRTSVYIAARKR